MGICEHRVSGRTADTSAVEFVRKRSRGHAAFTYLEMVIVIGILAIVLATGTLFLRGMMPKARVQATTDRLQAHLRAARMHAVSSSRPVNVSLDLAAKQLTTRIDENGNGSIDASETSIVTLTKEPQVLLKANCTSGSFRPGGGFTCAGGYWKVTVGHAGTDSLYVYAFQAGQVQATEDPLD